MRVEYRLAFGEDINTKTANCLRGRMCEILDRSDFGSIVILFSSSGGSAEQSISLFNFISQFPEPVRMHAIGHVGSAAIPVFLAGSNRTCEPIARFFFHEYNWGFSERQTLFRITEAIEQLQSDIDLSRQIIRNRTNNQVSTDLLQALDGTVSPVIITPEEAKEFALVNDVCSIANTGSNEIDVKVLSAGTW